MRAINHALTGALIGFVVPVPIVAVPLAFASHFALDTLPHFGVKKGGDINSWWFVPVLIIDAILCILLVTLLFLGQADHWLLACVCAFVAASPDLFSTERFLRARRGDGHGVNMKNPFLKFHHVIQNELPLGAVTEIFWSLGLVILLLAYTKA